MILKSKIFEIIKEGIYSFLYDIDGKRKPISPFIFKMGVFPLVLGLVCYYFNIVIAENLLNLLISTLGIFTALIFSLLFIGPEKFSNRVELYKGTKSIDIENYLVRFGNFAKFFTSRVALIILISIIMILSLIIIQQVTSLFIAKLLSAIFIPLAYYFLLLLLTLLFDIYLIMKDDITISKNRLNKNNR